MDAADILIVGTDHVRGVQLTDGEEIPADLVIVGIGIVPATVPLIAAGAAGANGVYVDEYCRTNLPDIYANGDCAAHANSYAGGALTPVRDLIAANASGSAWTIVVQPSDQPT